MENLTGQRFTDQNGKTKEVRTFIDSKGKKAIGHSGNSKFIMTASGIVHHETNKIAKRTMHACKMNKFM